MLVFFSQKLKYTEQFKVIVWIQVFLFFYFYVCVWKGFKNYSNFFPVVDIVALQTTSVSKEFDSDQNDPLVWSRGATKKGLLGAMAPLINWWPPDWLPWPDSCILLSPMLCLVCILNIMSYLGLEKYPEH